jgi:hypothetical protein
VTGPLPVHENKYGNPVATENLAADLRGWARGKGVNHVIAAVELLIWHEHWLRRRTFLEACVTHRAAGLVAIINWADAREFADSWPRGSTSELAVLDLAVHLGEDHFRLSGMGHAHRRSVANAFIAACGLAEIGVPDGT